MKKTKYPELSVLVKITAQRARAMPGRIIATGLLNIAGALIWTLGIASLQVLFDAVEATIAAPEQGLSRIVWAAVRIAAIMLGEKVLTGVQEYLRESQAQTTKRMLHLCLNRKAARLDPLVYENTDHLETAEKAAGGLDACNYLSDSFVSLFTYYVPVFIFMCSYLYNLRPLLLLVLALVFVPPVIAQVLRTKILANLEDVSSPMRRAMAHYHAAICSREYLKETRQIGAFSFFFRKLQRSLAAFSEARWHYRGRSQKVTMAMTWLEFIGYGGVLVLLAFSLRGGYISIGAFAAVYTSIEQLFDMVHGVVSWGFFSNVAECLPYARNYMTFMDLPERPVGDAVRPEGDIVFTDVSFCYPGREEPAVQGINLTLREGETIALVGENGAGKSTLVKLLTGVFLPTEGDITAGGVDVATLPIEGLFHNVSGVAQQYQRYAMSAQDNIAISHDDPTPERLQAAAEQADINLQSDNFPDGPDTMLSREFDGVDLSGGQWQRVAVARGLYRPHHLIVLDEPTAAIDPVEETAMYKRFARLAAGKTAVLVTHRLGSTRIADRIIVMENGHIAEIGTHEALLAQDGCYAKLFRAQAQWYVADA